MQYCYSRSTIPLLCNGGGGVFECTQWTAHSSCLSKAVAFHTAVDWRTKFTRESVGRRARPERRSTQPRHWESWAGSVAAYFVAGRIVSPGRLPPLDKLCRVLQHIIFYTVARRHICRRRQYMPQLLCGPALVCGQGTFLVYFWQYD